LLDAALLDERSQAPVASSRRQWWAAIAACLLGVGAGLMLAWKSRPVTPADRTAMPLVRMDFTLPEGVEVYSQNGPNASISPDGRDVVFTGATGGVRRLHIRHLDHEETEVLPGTETSNQCFFSPDGTAVGFLSSDRTLKRISLADHLVDVLGRDVERFYGAAWGGDDRITDVHEGELWQVPGSGGSPTRLTTLNRAAGERLHGWPFAINNGQAILFTVVTGTRPQDAHLEAVVVAGKTRHVIAESGRNPLYVPSGHLAFFRDDSFVAMPFDAGRLTATGSAFKLSEDILLDTVGGMLASVSSSGALVYESTAMAASRLVLVSREGIESALAESPRFHFSPRFGPDGHTIAVQSTGGLWLVDSQRGTSTLAQGSNQSVGNSYPVWTPDGSRIVFRTSNGLQWSSVDGRGDSAAIDETSLADIPNAVTLDGRTLIVTRQTAVTSGDIYAMSIASPSKPHALVSTPAYEGGARLSPDGHWLAYSSNETGRFEVYLRPYPSLDRRWPISTQGGTQVQWRRDGQELFFRRDNQMLAVALGSQAPPTPAPPRVLFEQQYSYGASQTIADYDVSPDGQRFLMVKSESSRSRLNIVFGWAEELKRHERAK
jgi:serine/threonine-protein kinase